MSSHYQHPHQEEKVMQEEEAEHDLIKWVVVEEGVFPLYLIVHKTMVQSLKIPIVPKYREQTLVREYCKCVIKAT